MNPTCTHRTTCRLCNSTRVELAVPIKPSPIADAYIPADRLGVAQESYPLDLYLCLDCGHVQLLDVVDPESLFGSYIYTTSISLGLVEHFRRYAEDVSSRFQPPAGSLVIDIGSNDGTLLRFFKERQYRVLGIDPAAEIAHAATAAGIPTLPDFFTSTIARRIRSEQGPASFVTANNVFAHSDHLADMADGIRELLADDGVFMFEVSYLGDILDHLLFDTVYHEHLGYHSIKPFALFCRRHGLELFDVLRMPTKGGSFRGFVQRLGGPRPVAPVVGEMIAAEAAAGMDQPATFQKYSARIDRSKQELLAIVKQLKAEGRTLAGFGASATVTTLIHHFEIGPFLDFLVDDNTSRHGLFSPGHHLPVLPPQALRDRKADHVIILAWQYATPILKRHAGFLEQGGHFIVPLPEIRVI